MFGYHMKKAAARIMPMIMASFVSMSSAAASMPVPVYAANSDAEAYSVTLKAGDVSLSGPSDLEGKELVVTDISSDYNPGEGKRTVFAYKVSLKNRFGLPSDIDEGTLLIENVSLPNTDSEVTSITLPYTGAGVYSYTADLDNSSYTKPVKAAKKVSARPRREAAAETDTEIVEHGYDFENQDVSWKLDKDGVLTVFPTDGKSGTLKHMSAPWNSVRHQVKKLVIKGTIHISPDATGTSSYYKCQTYVHFTNYNNCTEMDLSGLDVSSLTAFFEMFLGNPILEKIDTTGWDTSNVTNMHSTFAGLNNLTEIKGIENWNVSNVTDMSYMFATSSSSTVNASDKLTSLDLHKWRPEKVQDMQYFVAGRRNLKTLNTSGWHTPALSNLGWAFCESGVEEVDMSTWKPQGAVSMKNTFDRVYGLKKIDLSGWGPESVVEIYNTYINNYQAGVDPLEYVNIDGPSFSNGYYLIDNGGENLKYMKTGDAWGNFDEDATKSSYIYFPRIVMVMDNESIIDGKRNTLNFPTGAHTYIVPLLSYDANGGEGEMEGNYSVMASDSAKAEVKANSFTRPHYTFKNWNTQADGKGTSYAAGDEPDLRDNMTLYAQWTADTYTIKFDGNGSTSGEVQDLSGTVEDSLTASENAFTREGYTFSGWNTEKDGSGTPYNPGDTIDLDGNTTLYAQWTANTYTLSFNGGDGADGTMEDVESTIENPVAVPENAFTKDHYSFVKWNTKADGTGKDYNPGDEITLKGDVVLFAQWKADKYTVQYNANNAGASGTMDDAEGTYDKDFVIADNAFTAPKDMEFTVWNTEADASGTEYKAGQTVQNLAEDSDTPVTLYAQWKYTTYGLKFDGNNSTSGSMEDMSGTAENPLTVPNSTFERTDYAFKEWNSRADGTGTSCKPGDEITLHGNATLYAQWQANAYNVKFDGNGSTSGVTADIAGTAEESVTIPENQFERTGYTFTGWTSNADGSGDTYKPGDKLTLHENVTLYAQWKENAYTIKYDVNNENASGTMDDASASYSETVTLAGNKFTAPEHMHFSSWNTKADGTGTSYKPGQEVQGISEKNNETVTLYAQWKDDTYTIKFDANNEKASGTMKDAVLKCGEDVMIAENTFTAPQYKKFSSWNSEPDGSGTVYKPSDVVKSFSDKNGDTVTLYAQWEDRLYVISFDGNKSTSGSMDSITIPYGKSVNLPDSKFEKEGFSFLGWNTRADGTGTAYAAKDAVNETNTEDDVLKLYAQWAEEKDKIYTLKYDANSGDAPGYMADVKLKCGSDLTIAPSRYIAPHYMQFDSWNTSADGTGTSYEASQVVKSLTDKDGDTIALYAQWKDITYTVKFNGNESTSGSMEDVTSSIAKSVSIPENKFTKDGYRFMGWNTRADGMGHSYAAASTIDNSVTNDGTVTLYAQWKKKKSSSAETTDSGSSSSSTSSNSSSGTTNSSSASSQSGTGTQQAQGAQSSASNTQQSAASESASEVITVPAGEASAEGDTESASSKRKSNPITGDEMHMALWGILSASAAAALAVFFGIRAAKRRKEDGDDEE